MLICFMLEHSFLPLNHLSTIRIYILDCTKRKKLAENSKPIALETAQQKCWC